MMRHAWLLALGLGGCSALSVTQETFSNAPRPSACRASPEGGRLVADRGIGGTGAPSAQRQPPDQRTADRGIGGSGAPALQMPMQVADRGIGGTGIGGTGIIGVVTGFGSICLAGRTVELPDDVPVRMDDRPSDPASLRTGQVAAVGARKVLGALSARTIDILHTVIGPVDAASPGTLTVAGQQVHFPGATGPALDAKPGTWVAVSGLRRPDGSVEATRIDPAEPGLVTVRGELVRIYGATRIGSLGIRLPPSSNLPGGWSIVVTGHIISGVLVADTASIEPNENPSDYFGPATTNFIVEGYITATPGGYLVNHLFVAAPGSDTATPTRRGVVTFERTPDGKLKTTFESPNDLSRAAASPSHNDPFNPAIPGSTLIPRPPPPGPDDSRDRPSRGRR